jgi:hypothetical protein
MWRLTVGMILFFCFSMPGIGDQLHVIINGKAIHLKDGNYNEENWGIGFEYDFMEDQEAHWIPLITGSTFKDSNDDISNYLGGGIKRRFFFSDNSDGIHFDIGVTGFFMTRKDYHDGSPFFGALPFVSLGTKNIAINATYIPDVTPKDVPLLYFQLMIKIPEF